MHKFIGLSKVICNIFHFTPFEDIEDLMRIVIFVNIFYIVSYTIKHLKAILKKLYDWEY